MPPSIRKKGLAWMSLCVGFWGGRCVDIKMCNPHALSICSSAPKAVYRCHENTKKQTYEARIREMEHSAFVPLDFSAL